MTKYKYYFRVDRYGEALYKIEDSPSRFGIVLRYYPADKEIRYKGVWLASAFGKFDILEGKKFIEISEEDAILEML